MPIGAYAGLALTGASIKDAITDPRAQAESVLALGERLGTPCLLTAMDLSAEAEAFGASVRLSDGEMPALTGRLARTSADVDRMPSPAPGDGRTSVHLEAAAALVRASSGKPVLGGMIGPFSLASRLFGVAETLEATLSEPETMLLLLERVTPFLVEYSLAFRRVGAAGLIVAEPTAGLLSPRAFARFSVPFVRRIVAAAQGPAFSVVLHNCAARMAHLDSMLECGADFYHFGAPMDLPAAISRVDGRAVVCGNLEPTLIHAGPPQAVMAEAIALLDAIRLLGPGAKGRGFVLSSGCDLPPGTPLENIEALWVALDESCERRSAAGLEPQ
jgi:uroporphyrinogen decarboxylase